ncbi:ABC transporter permease subunit [Paenibacillus sp. LMG 31459]|uniref:ABC transporter permease subunit n=1 Tax=Paenibacillus phytohabitans TaxID=2654978 RepID=A0ABX1YRK9_9BACL|nr:MULTISPECIES: ABC transporter permease [Paenibacillus]AIQ32889.1 ABC transporter permease [Paenibacillus sp. FSL P4-0081]AIQ44192.1 ABC transporter permease [Paenibacillus sp. FSL R5-0912]NOU83715.1 ABC transporter permease subunit [Paenibacillus phytohabitans]
MTAKLKDSLYPVTFALGFLILWELAVRLLSVPMYLLPSPTQVVSAIDGSLWSHTLVTLGESLTGFMLANILGLITAVIFVHSKPIEKGMFPLAIALKTTPLVALAPLLVVWLGTGYTSKVIASMLICFFPILVNSVKGLKAIEYEAWELFSTYKGTKSEIFWKLRLPTSLPYIFSALKISTSLAIVGAIVGEFVGANKGLGYVVLVSSYHMDTPVMFSAIIASALCGLLLFWCIGLLEKKVIFWTRSDDL